MDKTTYIRELIDTYGAAAWEVLDDFGVELDDWDMRQTLDALCDDYDLDLKEVLSELRSVCDDDDYDDDDDDDDDDFDDFDDDDDRDDSWQDDDSFEVHDQSRPARSLVRPH